jgi:hypothetical protein
MERNAPNDAGVRRKGRLCEAVVTWKGCRCGSEWEICGCWKRRGHSKVPDKFVSRRNGKGPWVVIGKVARAVTATTPSPCSSR